MPSGNVTYFCTIPNIKFHKNPSVVEELFDADKQTDVTKLIITALCFLHPLMFICEY
jgi:hypothetical protein